MPVSILPMRACSLGSGNHPCLVVRTGCRVQSWPFASRPCIPGAVLRNSTGIDWNAVAPARVGTDVLINRQVIVGFMVTRTRAARGSVSIFLVAGALAATPAAAQNSDK